MQTEEWLKDHKLGSVFHEKKELLTVLAITILGLLLRLYQLGADSLWFDELGVAIAIQSANIGALFESVRLHVMAMPLDYVVDWLFVKSCQSEACLRLPAALWGSLTLPASYFLFRWLVDYKISALGTFLLAVSPLHIQYSQELRFYAPLVFFYILSTYLLLRALNHPTFWRWLAFSLIIILGSYFHLYVCLAFMNGFSWLLFSGKNFYKNRKILAGILVSFIAVSLIILPGYLYFRSSVTYQMFSYPELLINLMIGFGWLPAMLFPLQIGFLGYPLFFFFQLIGFSALWKSQNRMVLFWILSALIQVGVIVAANRMTQYAFRGRQVLIILPLLCLIAALGLLKVYQDIHNLLEKRPLTRENTSSKPANPIQKIYTIAMIAIGMLITILGLQSYYHLEKSQRREISTALIQHWKPQEEIWFTPGWETKFYGYYLKLKGHPEMESALKGDENIHITQGAPIPICWVTQQSLSANQKDLLLQTGFNEIAPSLNFTPDTQLLFCR